MDDFAYAMLDMRSPLFVHVKLLDKLDCQTETHSEAISFHNGYPIFFSVDVRATGSRPWLAPTIIPTRMCFLSWTVRCWHRARTLEACSALLTNANIDFIAPLRRGNGLANLQHRSLSSCTGHQTCSTSIASTPISRLKHASGATGSR